MERPGNFWTLQVLMGYVVNIHINSCALMEDYDGICCHWLVKGNSIRGSIRMTVNSTLYKDGHPLIV